MVTLALAITIDVLFTPLAPWTVDTEIKGWDVRSDMSWQQENIRKPWQDRDHAPIIFIEFLELSLLKLL